MSPTHDTQPTSPSGRRVAFLGATRGMGRALARVLAEQGDRLVLLGRDEESLERSARDLEIRSGLPKSDVGTAFCDLADDESFAPALQAATDHLGGLDVVVVTAGVFFPQEQVEEDVGRARQVMDLDFTKTVLFCEEARKRLLDSQGGTLCVFSSVAGDRGRHSVGIYGAAKAGLSRYLEALDHGYRRRGLVTIDVRPGFVHTSMTAGLKPPPFAGRPEQVALQVAKAIRRGTPKIYVPSAWRWVMTVVRNLPRMAMRRLSF
ncbi:MAG: SDR family NAD(P)-dependent oxidoreductase [Thermoanaerobaculia bacterium]|nr:SDR family NAD(P)-dependent oxidoreductase [Thermoanaerobaculia bacterium]